MRQSFKSICGIILAALLVACGVAAPVPTAAPKAIVTPSPVLTSAIPTILPAASTPTFNPRTFIITPNDLFSIGGLKPLSTPNPIDFCEHLPPPELVEPAGEVFLLSGRFALCPSRSRPVLNMAMDLDKGALVFVEDKSGDIVMEYAHLPVDGTISDYVHGLNNAQIDEIDTVALNYEYCEEILAGLNDPGALSVHDGVIACVLTTEGKVSLMRVEHIYPLDMQAVEFSFAVLR